MFRGAGCAGSEAPCRDAVPLCRSGVPYLVRDAVRRALLCNIVVEQPSRCLGPLGWVGVEGFSEKCAPPLRPRGHWAAFWLNKLQSQLPNYGVDPDLDIDKGDRNISSRLRWPVIRTRSMLLLLAEICHGHRTAEETKARAAKFLVESCGQAVEYLRIIPNNQIMTCVSDNIEFRLGQNGIVRGWSDLMQRRGMYFFRTFWEECQETSVLGAPVWKTFRNTKSGSIAWSLGFGVGPSPVGIETRW